MKIAELVARLRIDADNKPLKDFRAGLQRTGAEASTLAGKVQKSARALTTDFRQGLISTEKGLKSFAARLDVVKARADSVRTSMSKVGAPVAGLGTALGATVAAIGAAGAGVLAFTERIANAGDEVIKTAAKVGVGVEELQRLRFAAGRSGASVEVVTKAIQMQAKFIDEARRGAVTPFAEALSRVGLTLKEIERTKGPEARFGLIADALADIPDAGKRTSLAMKLLGEETGPQLVPLLAEGSRGIRALGDEAERLGAVMSTEAAEKSAAFADTMTNVRARLDGILTRIGVELMPIVQASLERFGAWVDDNGERLADVLGGAFAAVARTIEFLGDNVWILKTLGVLLGVVTAAVGILTVAAGILGTTMMVAFSPVLAPILAIGAAIAAVAGAWIAWGPSFDEVKDGVVRGINAIIDALESMVQWLGIAADFSGMRIDVSTPNRPKASTQAPAVSSAATAASNDTDEFDVMLRRTLAFQTAEQDRQARRKAQAPELTQKAGRPTPPDPWTQAHRSEIENQLAELAKIAGDAEYERSRDAAKAGEVAKDTLKQLREDAKRGIVPERRDFVAEQEARNREFIEERARAAGERVLFQGAAAADAAANAERRRLEAAGATAPTRPRGIFDALGIGGLGPGVASNPYERVQATSRVNNFHISVPQDIDTTIHLEGTTDVEGLYQRLSRGLGKVLDDSVRAALLDIRDAVEA